MLSLLLHKLFAVPGDLMPNFFALSRSHQSSCSFAAMEISLLVIAKLPRCIGGSVVLERYRNFVEMTKGVNVSRGWRQQLFVVVMPFENKRVSICPSDWRQGFLAHNCAFDFGVTLLTGRLVEWQINFCKGVAGTLINRCLCPLRRKWRTGGNSARSC